MLNESVKMMAHPGTKYAVIHDTSLSDLILKDLTQKLKIIHSSYNCFGLEQTFIPKSYFWKFNTENSFWIMRTLERIVASGIMFKWYEWSTWQYMLNFRLNGYTQEHISPDYINLGKLRPVVAICTIMLIVGVIVSYELYVQWRKQDMAFVWESSPILVSTVNSLSPG